MLDESFEYGKDTLTKKMTLIGQKKIVYDGIYCENSFYLLSKQNILREKIYIACTNKKFEWVIMFLIITSSLKLVIDSYIIDSGEQNLLILSSRIDYFFTAAFALESLLKSIAFGFAFDKGSYLRETWSQLDFFIVVMSLIDASFDSVKLPVIKVLRLLRTLRPLRFISHNSGMKTIVMALV